MKKGCIRMQVSTLGLNFQCKNTRGLPRICSAKGLRADQGPGWPYETKTNHVYINLGQVLRESKSIKVRPCKLYTRWPLRSLWSVAKMLSKWTAAYCGRAFLIPPTIWLFSSPPRATIDQHGDRVTFLTAENSHRMKLRSQVAKSP